MKKLLLVLFLFLLSACESPPVAEVVKGEMCIPVEDVTFYASTQTTVTGTKDVVMLETEFGDTVVKQNIYEYAVLDVYSHVCVTTEDGVATDFASARLKDIDVPEPEKEYVDVPGETVYVDVPGETVYVNDMSTWVVTEHESYYYTVQPGVVHIVYTGTVTLLDVSEMLIVTVVFDENLVFSNQVMIPSITRYLMGTYEDVSYIDEEFVDTEYDTIEEYIDNFIDTNTYQDVSDMFLGGTDEEIQ